MRPCATSSSVTARCEATWRRRAVERRLDESRPVRGMDRLCAHARLHQSRRHRRDAVGERGARSVYLEAQACARVLVASDIAPAREVVTEGETGSTVPGRRCRRADRRRRCRLQSEPGIARASSVRHAPARVQAHGLCRCRGAVRRRAGRSDPPSSRLNAAATHKRRRRIRALGTRHAGRVARSAAPAPRTGPPAVLG